MALCIPATARCTWWPTSARLRSGPSPQPCWPVPLQTLQPASPFKPGPSFRGLPPTIRGSRAGQKGCECRRRRGLVRGLRRGLGRSLGLSVQKAALWEVGRPRAPQGAVAITRQSALRAGPGTSLHTCQRSPQGRALVPVPREGRGHRGPRAREHVDSRKQLLPVRHSWAMSSSPASLRSCEWVGAGRGLGWGLPPAPAWVTPVC